MFATARYWLVRLANPAAFVVTIADGVARLAKGTAPAAWIEDCTRTAADFAIVRGHVEGVRTHRGIELRFSPTVPAASHQRFRNVFGTYLARRG